MLSQFFTYLNVFALLLLEALLAVDIEVTHNFPAQVNNNTEFKATLTFKKGKLDESGKFTLNLPEGLSATVDGEIPGDGSFTFDNGKAMIIWQNLPKAQEVEVVLNVKVGANVNGEYVINGKFSALEDNERRIYQVPDHQIVIGTPPSTGEEEAPVEVNAGCSRTVTQTGPGEYTIELAVVKEGIEGFARVEEFIPEGAEAAVLANNQAQFSTVEDMETKAKFVWMRLPKEDNFTVSYTLKTDKEVDFEAMNGKFSYLENEEIKNVSVTTSGVSLNPNAETPADPPATTPDPTDPATNGGIDPDQAMTREELLQKKKDEEAAAKAEEEAELERLRELDRQKAAEAEAAQKAADEAAQKASDEAAQKAADEAAAAQKAADEAAQKAADEAAQQAADEAAAQKAADEAAQKAADEAAQKAADEAAAAQRKADEEAAAKADEEAAAKAAEEKRKQQEAEEERKRKEEEERKRREALAQQDQNQGGTSGVTSTPAPQTGINYRVQISAGQNLVDKVYFEKRHSFTGDFYIENHEGWIKYTTGSFGVYKGARDQREDFKAAGHNFPGPFVTAYNDGARITVQEALMITNQKWYQ